MRKAVNILVIDDQESCRARIKNVCLRLKEFGDINVLEASSLETAKGILFHVNPVPVIILDKNLKDDPDSEDANGIEGIPELLEIQPNSQVLTFTSSDSIQDCEAAMSKGAYSYIVKSYSDASILDKIRKTLEFYYLKREQIISRIDESNKNKVEFVGNSKAVERLRMKLNAMSTSGAPVLLLGESGTGKTTAAKFIHSKRIMDGLIDGDFISKNITAIPSNLIESELFGSEKGGFTDAVRRQGLIELAHGGTLFLDEIADASLEVQQKLLTVIESGEFTRVGGDKVLRSEFKLICATNKNLEELVREGKFREDLYYRISILTTDMPSLSERKEDIPEIIKQLLPEIRKICSTIVSYEDIPQDFIQYLQEIKIPGNIRSLQQYLIRLFTFSPTDKNNRPVLKKWKETLGIRFRKANTVVAVKEPITLGELQNRPFGVIDDQFMGLDEFSDLMFNKLIEEAKAKHSDKTSALAKILKVNYYKLYRHIKENEQEISRQQ